MVPDFFEPRNGTKNFWILQGRSVGMLPQKILKMKYLSIITVAVITFPTIINHDLEYFAPILFEFIFLHFESQCQAEHEELVNENNLFYFQKQGDFSGNWDTGSIPTKKGGLAALYRYEKSTWLVARHGNPYRNVCPLFNQPNNGDGNPCHKI